MFVWLSGCFNVCDSRLHSFLKILFNSNQRQTRRSSNYSSRWENVWCGWILFWGYFWIIWGIFHKLFYDEFWLYFCLYFCLYSVFSFYFIYFWIHWIVIVFNYDFFLLKTANYFYYCFSLHNKIYTSLKLVVNVISFVVNW